MISPHKGYMMPSKDIVDLVDVTPVPAVSLSPDHKTILLLDRSGLPGIDEVAAEELRLAGLRIDPKTFSASRSGYFTNIKIKNGTHDVPVRGLPKNPKLRHLTWSRDGSKLAFTHTTKKGLELWYVNVKEGQAYRLTGPEVNAALGGMPCQWMPDNETIIFRAKTPDQINFPEKPLIPGGPVIQENDGKSSPVRTYQDLLKNPYDEAVFEYFSFCQYVEISVNGKRKPLGKPGMYRVCSPSPDGRYFLVFLMKKPFSYIVPYRQFPLRISIWDRNGNEIMVLADVPVADDIPKGFGAVRKGPRSFYWRADKPATLYWAEALDGGDPKTEVEFRDRLYKWDAPFTGKPEKSIATRLRFGNLTWGDEGIALVEEWQWKNRITKMSVFNPDDPEKPLKTIFERSWEDKYNDPGIFQTQMNQFGRYVLLRDKDEYLYLIGEGDSPEGKRPFLNKFDLSTGETEQLWRSQSPYFEVPLEILSLKPLKIITRRESKSEQPNYFIRHLETNTVEQITHFPHPYEQLKDVPREIIRYQRNDGVDLQGKLYLPAGYNKAKDGPLPILLWAYPKEFKSPDAAGQVTDSPYHFMRLSSLSPLLLLTQGYGVLLSFSMPVIGEGEEEPNERFIEQISANAQAAVDKLVDLGVGDRNKMAIGGHSYGAFMTANLLAHTGLFAAGIARSGAYNRTLTPFGFQSEERTFWETPKTYMEMSPFSYAHKINTPLLLIHGEADNNSGTFPLQSERFYNALKGHGARVRLVMLPHESHAYRARESILHMHWEMKEWLDRYLKN